MNIKINVKGVSNKKNKISQIDYIYPDMEYTLKDFISETVRISVRQYNKMHAGRIRPSK